MEPFKTIAATKSLNHLIHCYNSIDSRQMLRVRDTRAEWGKKPIDLWSMVNVGFEGKGAQWFQTTNQYVNLLDLPRKHHQENQSIAVSGLTYDGGIMCSTL